MKLLQSQNMNLIKLKTMGTKFYIFLFVVVFFAQSHNITNGSNQNTEVNFGDSKEITFKEKIQGTENLSDSLKVEIQDVNIKTEELKELTKEIKELKEEKKQQKKKNINDTLK